MVRYSQPLAGLDVVMSPVHTIGRVGVKLRASRLSPPQRVPGVRRRLKRRLCRARMPFSRISRSTGAGRCDGLALSSWCMRREP